MDFPISGTEFMARLHEQLQYFIKMKISTDTAWQGIRVYLSGHNVSPFEFVVWTCVDPLHHNF